MILTLKPDLIFLIVIISAIGPAATPWGVPGDSCNWEEVWKIFDSFSEKKYLGQFLLKFLQKFQVTTGVIQEVTSGEV